MDFRRGEILFDPNFTYPDGGTPCDKLLLIINKNHSSPDEVVIIPAKTRIDSDPYPYADGCNQKPTTFYFEKQIGFYRAGTVIQLYHIETKLCGDIEERINKRQIDRLNKLATQEEFGRIFNCLKTMKYDIPLGIQELIF